MVKKWYHDKFNLISAISTEVVHNTHTPGAMKYFSYGESAIDHFVVEYV
jgi:hypothetical protein